MQLLFLLLVLFVPGTILTLVERQLPGKRVAWTAKGRAGISLFLVVTSSSHFVRTAAMAEMLPPVVPFRIELIYLTGVLELLGAIGVWVAHFARVAGQTGSNGKRTMTATRCGSVTSR